MRSDTGGLVDSSQVLRTNARTARTFMGRVVGRFERTGPNSWDPYALVAEDGRTVEVPPGVEIQVEDKGARFRVRAYGAVHVVEWIPAEDETGGGSGAGLRARFLETCVSRFRHKTGIGAAAYIAKNLR